jgi:hypothetical protein
VRRLKVRSVRGAAIATLGSVAIAVVCLSLADASGHNSRTIRIRHQEGIAHQNAQYKVDIAIDYAARSYSGTELLKWVNTDDRPTSVVFFHLYPNLRVPYTRPNPPVEMAAAAARPAPDEPHLDVTGVQASEEGGAFAFSVDEQETTLKVTLNDPIPAGGTADIFIKFKGTVPEIDPEETGLLAHVVQQVGAALRSEREVRRARDVNNSCRGFLMMGTPFPILAVHDGSDWQRKVEPSIGDSLFSEMADFDVTVRLPTDVVAFSSGRNVRKKTENGIVDHVFKGENLREFAIVAGRNLRVAERTVNGINVRSIYPAEHEVVGLRVLNQAVNAVRIFTTRFGELPIKTISVIDVPLVAGLGSIEFSGLSAIASAFYVNFDSPQIKNLPELIREQRSSVEDSLEWTVAHVIAHQWWGTVVGSDPLRSPVQDEALANYSALLYYEDAHTEERARVALDDQLRGVYKVYRTFGGEDMPADKSAHDYRNFFQYSAIVACKGALMFAELRRLLGDQRFFSALKAYYSANEGEIAEMDDLRGAFLAEALATKRRAVSRTFNRWLSSKRGDEDISPPDPRMAAELGLNPSPVKSNDRNAFTRLGKFFWQQMTRIR